MVLEDALGANYIVDPSIQGRITVQTSNPIPTADLAPLLDGVLRVNGAALVRVGDLYKVVPIDQAVVSGASPTTHQSAPRGDPRLRHPGGPTPVRLGARHGGPARAVRPGRRLGPG